MKITIIDILLTSDHSVIVSFHTDIGSGKARWHDGIPQVGKDYHVEFDIPKTLAWGIDLIETDNDEFLIGASGDSLLFQGQVEQIDSDGVIAVRVGDALILVQAEVGKEAVGKYVEIIAKQVVLYDTNV